MAIDWPLVKDVLEALSYLTVVIGAPVALYQYRVKTRKEQSDREYGTYNALDEKYLEFLELCRQSPRLDVFDIPDDAPAALTPEEQKQELIAFTMLISIFERAFLMYHDQEDSIRKRQWTGWLDYIRDYCERANFRHAWTYSGDQFDTEFQAFMTIELARADPDGVADA
ncbi:MAG TPA: hypothetical protein VF824_00700 [Thermoanaerobaculia bacterium]|jgi:hypothetical protein